MAFSEEAGGGRHPTDAPFPPPQPAINSAALAGLKRGDRRRIRLTIPQLAILLCLAGCATTPPSVKVCPALSVYSAADQKAAAAELRALPAGSVIARMIVDYSQLRAEVRACEAS